MVWHTTIGSGPTKVVVIHGWFWDHRVFAPIFDCLDTDRATYAFIDIRGYGNSAINTGYYTFSYVKDGEAKTIPARYSFTYVKNGDRWMIADHHSSAIPAAPLR